jgi:hypothetical protein
MYNPDLIVASSKWQVLGWCSSAWMCFCSYLLEERAWECVGSSAVVYRATGLNDHSGPYAQLRELDSRHMHVPTFRIWEGRHSAR